jgi:hypothetical protein
LVPVLSMKDGVILSYVSWGFGKSLRAPKQQITIVFRELIVWRVVQCARWAVVSAKVAEAAARVPVLWKTLLRVLRILFVVCYWYQCDASFRADPSADSAASAFLHIEQVSASKSFRKQNFLIGVLHREGALEHVLDAFVHGSKNRCAHSPSLPVCLHGPVVQTSIDDWHVADMHVPK